MGEARENALRLDFDSGIMVTVSCRRTIMKSYVKSRVHYEEDEA